MLISILLVADIAGVTTRYLSEENYAFPSEKENYFTLSPEEEKIREDKSYYRVFSVQEGLNGARTSYNFHSVGGYHAAKPRRVQELFDYQLYKNKNNQVLNLLNVKYILQTDRSGAIQVIQNPEALGNAWFVKQLSVLENADKLMQSLDTLSPKTQAVTIDRSLKDTRYPVDSLASITLKKYEPDRLVYTTENQAEGLAVFSEIYYPHGWTAVLDDTTPLPIHQVDYILRAVVVPAGKHTLTFTFAPKIVQTGGYISLASTIAFVLIAMGMILTNKKLRTKE